MLDLTSLSDQTLEELYWELIPEVEEFKVFKEFYIANQDLFKRCSIVAVELPLFFEMVTTEMFERKVLV